MNTQQEITKLAAEMAEHINENKSPEGYTIVCTRRELRQMVEDATLGSEDVTFAMSQFFDEMEWEHNMFLEVSQFDDIVLDERGEEFLTH